MSPRVNQTSMGGVYVWLSPTESIKTKQLTEEFWRL